MILDCPFVSPRRWLIPQSGTTKMLSVSDTAHTLGHVLRFSQHKLRPDSASPFRALGTIALDPWQLPFGDTPPNGTAAAPWPLAVLDRFADHVGAPLGLAAIDTGVSRTDHVTTIRAFVEGAPPGHGVLLFSSAPALGFLSQASLRYACVQLIDAISRTAGAPAVRDECLFVDAHSAPGVVSVSTPSRDLVFWTSADPAVDGLMTNNLNSLGTTGTHVVGAFSGYQGSLPLLAKPYRPTGRFVDVDPFLWGLIVDSTAKVKRVLCKATTHELANRILQHTAGHPGPDRNFALMLLRDDEITLDVTLALPSDVASLDLWSEALAAGYNAADIDALALGRVTGASISRTLSNKKKRTISVAAVSAASSARQTGALIDFVGGVWRTKTGTTVTLQYINDQIITPQFVADVIDVADRGATIRALEAALGISVFDSHDDVWLRNDWVHIGTTSTENIEVAHFTAPQTLRQLAVPIAFWALNGLALLSGDAAVTQALLPPAGGEGFI